MEPRYLIGGPSAPEQPKKLAERPEVKPTKVIDPVIEGKYKGKTAAQWRKLIADSKTISAAQVREYLLCASLAQTDGMWTFPALFTLTGAMVKDATYVRVKKSDKWVWRIGSGETATWFTPSKARSGAQRRHNDAAKGFRVGQVRRRAHVASKLSGKGNMFSYIAEVESGEIEIIDNGTLASYPDWS